MHAYSDEELDRLPHDERRKVKALFTIEQLELSDFSGESR